MQPLTRTIALVSLAVAAVLATALPANAGTTSDKAIAEAGIIADTDIPAAGWTKATNTDDTSAARKLAQKTKGCQDYVAFTKTFASTTNAVSPDYSTASEELSNRAYVYKTDAAATKAFARASAPRVAKCLQTMLTKQFAASLESNPELDAQVDTYQAVLKVVPEVADAVGDESVGYGGGIAVRGTDGSVDQLQVTTLVARVGRAILTYTYQFGGSTGSAAVFDTAITNTIARAEAAQA